MEEKISFNREVFDHRNEDRHIYKVEPGINEDVVRAISSYNKEPEWMLQKRLKALEIFNKLKLPDWGPDISSLDLNKITYFLIPDAKQNAKSWEDVPEDIKKTFEKLGIPEAERKVLAGAGATYDSMTVYHNLKKDLEEQGVIFKDCNVALKEHEDLFKKYFMTNCISPSLHKFAALHAAVWSSGTFIYVPPGVKVTLPLQAYFRMNAESGGQFEHTLIIVDKDAELSYVEGCSSPRYTTSSLHAGCVEIHVAENARARYHSIENWSKKTYNLNTKRAVVQKNGIIEWVNGNNGSACTMLYPCSILVGENSKSDFLGIAFAGANQFQDTGHKVYHLAKNTTSTVRSKSISKDGGITVYRGLLKINKGATNSKSSVVCDALIMDEKSKSDTIPYMDIKENDVDIGHEATVGRISYDQLLYLMSRGLTEDQARQMIVSGFIEPIAKALPLEYAVELNRLIQLEMEGSVG